MLCERLRDLRKMRARLERAELRDALDMGSYDDEQELQLALRRAAYEEM